MYAVQPMPRCAQERRLIAIGKRGPPKRADTVSITITEEVLFTKANLAMFAHDARSTHDARSNHPSLLMAEI